MAVAKAKPRKSKRRIEQDRQRAIATQHGLLFAFAPLLVFALVAHGSLAWEQSTDAIFLAWVGNIAGGWLRYHA